MWKETEVVFISVVQYELVNYLLYFFQFIYSSI